MKTLCIADTCSLIYLSNTDVRIGNRLIYKWLWDEFDIRYSQSVLSEINRHRKQIIGNRKYELYVWPGQFAYCEKKLFGNTLERTMEQGICPHCRQIIFRTQKFTPDLYEDQDRGERHNCCVAIEAIKNYSQIIFLTDDMRANRDYVSKLFDTMPLGVIWSSMDFVVYLFTKYRGRISLDETLEVLRSVNAQDSSSGAQKSVERLTRYMNKVKKIDGLLS